MVSLQALTSTSPPNPPLRFSTWDCFASIQSYPHTLVYIIVPLQESSKSASASLVKRPQPHSSLQDQVDWSLPIKWTPRSTGPSTHIRNLALPLWREASATLALPPLSPTTSVSRGRLTLTSLSSHRGCRPLFSCQKIAKKIINLCPNQLVACSCSCC